MLVHCHHCYREFDTPQSDVVECPFCHALIDTSVETTQPDDPNEMSSYWSVWTSNSGSVVSVSAVLISWPQRCCCCLGPPQTECSVSFSRIHSIGRQRVPESKSWRMPICLRCLSHTRWAFAHQATALGCGCLGLLTLLFIIGASGASANAGSPVPLILFCGFTALACLVIAVITQGPARQAISPNCCHAWAPVRYLGWYRTIHTFSFANGEYAQLFMQANRRKIVY